MFAQKGVVRSEGASMPGDDVQLALIDAGADDISAEDGALVIAAPKEALQAVAQAVAAAGITASSIAIEWIPKDLVAPPADTTPLIELLEALDDDEDVDAVFTNIDV
jgi:transcriptional/translational regulatory protein YebC/TACO1